MIKLQRATQPDFLTPEKIEELTKNFKETGNSVWNNKSIKQPLLNSSHKKCAYCECSLQKESNYMEVEHFEDKKNNPDKVVLWENLLPSCKRCNLAKGVQDVLSEPILNPYVDTPNEHIGMRLYRLKKLTDKGQCTIDVANLNDSERLVFVRFKIGEKIHQKLEQSQELLKSYLDNKSTRTKNRLYNTIKELLLESQPTAEYSASTATVLLSDDDFWILRESLKSYFIWDGYLDTYLQSAQQICLPSLQ